MTRVIRRCAIYTRKSTEDGLDQEFNSLDAQREACEAFIASQRSEGWKALPDRYDDGGVSGGTLEREAIQRLLADVDDGKIDIVVVYKIDRLTRSLADFAKIVERLDQKAASFVSVTQQFNTSTSMGRLTLNVLLSFAQFEREVTAERIRDKIAASKRKGLWMGGYVPLGYDAVERRLLINSEEAEVVRRIFCAFADGADVRDLAASLDAEGIRSKARKNGVGGSRFSRGAIYKILSNPIYRGKIRHGKLTYDGVHDAIIDEPTWALTAARLEAGKRRAAGPTPESSVLTGKLYADGEPLTPTHATNHGRRYRYYVSRSLIDDGASDASGWRLPAAEVESAIAELIREWLASDCGGVETARAATIDEEASRSQNIAALNQQSSRMNSSELLAAWIDAIDRIEIDEAGVCVTLDTEGLKGLGISPGDGPIEITQPIRLARRGVGRKIIIGDAAIRHDKILIDLIRITRRWRTEIFERGAALKDLAEADGVDQGDASRFFPLAFLAPDIALSILEGRQRVSLTAEKLKRLQSLPPDWRDQRTLLGA